MSTQHVGSRVADAARGALDAQQLLGAIDRGKASPGSLLVEMRRALTESPCYADAFARQLEKALQPKSSEGAQNG